jgi:hypothetical protein
MKVASSNLSPAIKPHLERAIGREARWLMARQNSDLLPDRYEREDNDRVR